VTDAMRASDDEYRLARRIVSFTPPSAQNGNSASDS